MFITVRFGDDQSEIFNPVCTNCNLLQAIKEKCDIHSEDTVDLSDELGQVKLLHRRLGDYATEYFEHRETLILLRVEKENETKRFRYMPLVTELLKDQDFIARLNPEKPLKSGYARRHILESDAPRSGKRSSKHSSHKLTVNAPPGVNMNRRNSRRGSVISLKK